MFEDQSEDSATESVETAPQVKEDLGTRYYSVELPSNGKLGYPKEIEYRDILVRDEKILSTATGANYEKILGKILKSLIKDTTWFNDITIYDRDFLLLWIWANNYSTEKTFDVTCPHCNNKDELAINITEIDIDDISDEYVDPFSLELANGKTATLRLMTVGDEKIATEFVAKNKGKSIDDIKFALTTDFGVVMPINKKLEYMEEHLTGRDMGMIRAFHDYFKYGINDNVEHSCTACQEVTEYSIPFSLEFFLPTLRNDFEKMLHANKKHGNKSD
jgi:T4 bacteriophage base plate protein